MQVLNEQQIAQVSGGANLIQQIHRAEWNSYGVPLVNSGIFVWNLLVPGAKVPYVSKTPA